MKAAAIGIGSNFLRMLVADIEDGKLKNVQFLGGCNGNLKGIGALVEGMEVEEAIRRWFLDNTHRVTVLLLPDAGLAQARQAEEDARIEALRSSMKREERVRIVALAAELRAAQQAPDLTPPPVR